MILDYDPEETLWSAVEQFRQYMRENFDPESPPNIKHRYERFYHNIVRRVENISSRLGGKYDMIKQKCPHTLMHQTPKPIELG